MVRYVAVFIVETDKQQYGEAHGLRGVLRELHAGRGPEAMRNMLALNVGMSIYLLEGKLPLATCIAKAREALASGVGGRVLHAA